MDLSDPRSLKRTYHSALGDDLVGDFLSPVLTHAKTYDRVTGDFSSRFLAAAAYGLSDFFLREGRMRLITNGRFRSDDLEAIRAGENLQTVAETRIRKQVENFELDRDELEENHLAALAWLLKEERLTIRVAFPVDEAGRPVAPSEAEQHQKVGVAGLGTGDKIAFVGGVNSSYRGYTSNNESIACFYSWEEGDDQTIGDFEALFDRLWRDEAPRSITVSVPEACRRSLVEEYAPSEPPDLPGDEGPVTSLEGLPPEPSTLFSDPFDPWDHQARAIRQFLDARAGILEMATGTGKTWTALSILDRLHRQEEISGVIVATYGNDLLEQWYQEVLSLFSLEKIAVYREFANYHETGEFARHRAGPFPFLITSIDRLPKLWEYTGSDPSSDLLFICDEVHNLGSEARMESLEGKLDSFTYRLGLSATPERPYDDQGNQFIEKQIGDVVFTFGLEEAIRADILCPFDYIALEYSLSEEDQEARKEAFARYSAAKEENPQTPKDYLYRLLADVRKKSEEKLPVLRRYLEDNPESLEDAIFFTATKEYGEKVQKIVHGFTKRYHTYYGEDDEANLRKFSKGDLDALITCEAISEGIDIKAVSNIFLLSSDRSKLQTIQRIGRALRKDPDNPAKRAQIIDFVVREDIEEDYEDEDYTPADKDRHDWLTELSRVQ